VAAPTLGLDETHPQRPTKTAIHPESHELAIGDLIRTYRPVPRSEPLGSVAAVELPRLLIVYEPERGVLINSS